jgi:hypothetical protein
MLKDSMFNKESRRKGHFFSFKGICYRKAGRSKSRKSRGYDNHDKSRGKSKSKIGIKCFYYGKPRHIKRECKKFNKEILTIQGKVLVIYTLLSKND